MARQAPPGARANRGAPPRAAAVARRAPGYARSSPAATRGLEECPPPPLRRRGGETGPGLQDGSDPFFFCRLAVRLAGSVATFLAKFTDLCNCPDGDRSRFVAKSAWVNGACAG